MDDGSVTNDDLVKLMWELYPNGPSLGLKIVLQSLAGRLQTLEKNAASGHAHQRTAPAKRGAVTAPVSVAECQKEETANVPEDVSEKRKEKVSASADVTDGPLATDDPIKDMPQSARERADIRMGKNRKDRI